jgi:hypothetical protein
MAKKSDDEYSVAESEWRLQAALRGSRITGHKPMTDIPKKPRKSGKIPLPKPQKRPKEK